MKFTIIFIASLTILANAVKNEDYKLGNTSPELIEDLDEKTLTGLTSKNQLYLQQDGINDIRRRLLSTEQKIDHILMHFKHDMTPYQMQMTPMGYKMMP